MNTVPVVGARLAAAVNWLVAAADREPMLDALHRGWCEHLVAAGLPVWRSSLGLEVLHPEISGIQHIWTDAAVVVTEAGRAQIDESPDYLASPMRVVDETGLAVRRRLDGLQTEFPLLEALREKGATDYVMFPLAFVDRMRSAAVSYATRRPEGFSAADIEALQFAVQVFSPYAERWVLRRVAVDLLDTYVGRRSGRRVFEGSIARGRVETIDAAVFLADLRGFTALSESQPISTVVELLNAWLDAMVEAVEHADGEVLKFLGDGILAIFPVGADGRGAAARALGAARAAGRKIDDLNRGHLSNGLPALDFGIGLHVGQVAYGNIGGRRRLDFTVVGPVVNEASRLQGLCRDLARQIVASAPFAGESGGDFVSLGRHAMRGVPGTHEVFGLADDPTR